MPVNDYRWFRGFNDTTPGRGAACRAGSAPFYYPPKSKDCGDCHMPLVASNDSGNERLVHSHRFPAANTAVPFANHDAEQMKATGGFPAGRQL